MLVACHRYISLQVAGAAKSDGDSAAALPRCTLVVSRGRLVRKAREGRKGRLPAPPFALCPARYRVLSRVVQRQSAGT
jgi:hypothetical protein